MYNIESIYKNFSESEKSHSTQVTKLAVLIFQNTQFLHELGDKELEYLKQAAKYHDIGRTISSSEHYIKSYEIIVNSALKGFTKAELEVIAQIARYHSGKIPSKFDKYFKKLDNSQKRIVKKLAGILRVADLLDREHLELVKNIDFEFIKEGRILVMQISVLQKGYFPDVKILAKKKILLEKTFIVQLLVKLAK